MHYCFEDYKYEAARTNIFDNSNPFAIAWLRSPRSANLIGLCNDFCCQNHPHLKAGFVKAADIIIENPESSDYSLYALKPALNKVWILAFSSLIVVVPIIFKYKRNVAADNFRY